MHRQSFTREDVIRLGQTGDPSAFINLATNVLQDHPEDADVRLLLTQRLIEFGLFHRAVSVAEGFPAELQQHPEIRSLVSQLRAPAANGLAGWEQTAERYRANLAALQDRPHLAEAIDRAWRQRGGDLELHRTGCGLWQVFDRGHGQTGAWRPSFGDHRPSESFEQIRAKVENQIIAPLVIDGVGLGEQLPLLHRATQNTRQNACPILYVVEADFLAVAVALHLQDWRQAIDDDRVLFCLGAEAYEQLASEIDSREWVSPPGPPIASEPWSPDTSDRAQRAIDRAVADREARCTSIRQSLAPIYRDLGPSHWGKRFAEALSGEGRPLRVLGITSRYTTVLQYSLRDALIAFEELGSETHTIIEPDDHSFMSPEPALRIIRDFEPDLVFMIDHTRKSPSVAPIQIPGLPVVTWIQDRLSWLFDENAGRALESLDFCLGIGAEELTKRYAYPAARFLPCEMATNPQILTEGRDSRASDVDSEFDCDVAFATHASETPETFYRQYLRQCTSDGDRRIVEALYEKLRSLADACELNGALDCDHLVERLAGDRDINAARRDALAAQFVRPLAERFLRHQTVEWIAAWAERTGRRFHLYGNGWEHHERFAAFARGAVEHGRDLGRAFRGAKINIHAGCNPAFHQRVLDGLSAGGFFLIREHGADVSHRVYRPMYAWIEQQGLRPPATIHAEDLPEPLQSDFRRLRSQKGIDAAAPIQLTDHIYKMLRDCLNPDEPGIAGVFWPEFEELVFGSATELADRLEHFLDRADRRRSIAASMRERTIEQFSYKATMRRLLDWLTLSLGAGAVSRDQTALVEAQ